MASTTTPTFDEAAARAWLEGPDPDEPGYTVAESVGVDGATFDFEADNWPYLIDGLVAQALETGLLPKGTLVWLISDNEGCIDGALVTRDFDESAVRLCSAFLNFADLIDDRYAKGVDSAVSALSAIHALAAELTL